MSSAGSVTDLIRRVQAGDAAAAQELWDRYSPRLRRLASAKLPRNALALGDEEDVALSALASVFRGLQGGQFTLLSNRDDLWNLLVLFTTRKAIDLIAHEGRKKRRPGKGPTADPAAEPRLDKVLDPRPPPDLEALLGDQYRRLLVCLRDGQLERIAVWKLEGYENEEIAALLECSERSVARKLRLIRAIWEREMRR